MRKFIILFTLIGIGLIYAPDVLARAGGGRNDGGGGILYLILMPFLIIYGWYINKKINEKKIKTSEALGKMAQKDPMWTEQAMESWVKESFFAIQRAWCEQDLEKLKTLLHPDLFNEWKSQIEFMNSRGERDVMEDLAINEVRLVEAKNYLDNSRDSFTACIDAQSIDYAVDRDGNIVSSNTGNKKKKENKEKSLEKIQGILDL